MSPETKGRTSRVTGRRQASGLRLITAFAAGAAALGVLVPGSVGMVAGIAAVAAITVAPLLRVLWLTFRWWQEGDIRFTVIGLALLGVIGIGSTLAALLT